MTSSATIGEIALELRSGFASGGHDPGGVVQFRMNNVDRSGGINWDKLRRVPPSKVRDDLLVESGDILFNATNSPELVGKTALFTGFSEPLTFSNHFVRIRSRRKIAEPAYVARWLQREFERGRFERMCRAWVNQASITQDQLASLEIPLPSIDEQRRIAAILDKADALRRKQQKSKILISDLSDAMFVSMFGPCRPGSAAWPTSKVSDAGRVQLGRQRAPKYQTGKFTKPYVRVANVYEDRIDTADVLKMDFNDSDFRDYKLKYGDVLLNEGQSTELVGRPAMWRSEIDDCCFQNTLVRFQANRTYVMPEFALALFLRYFRSGEFAKISSKTSSVAHLGAGRFGMMPFPLPPLDLQREFSERVAAIDRLKRKYGANTKKVDELFSSLQSRAFSGQL